jgi:hypothetical protein
MTHIRTSDQDVLDLGFGGYTCNWGVHIAGLYETARERDEIIFGFLNRGDLDGDLQFYAPSERTVDEFHKAYAARHPHCAGHSHAADRFRVVPATTLYCPDGTFSPWDMERSLEAFYRESRRNGGRSIRATAEMSWALETMPGAEHLMAYESRLNYFIPGKPWISVCLYDVTRFSGKMIMQVLQTHPYVINGGVITENPYFQDPTRWLTKNAPEFLSENRPPA